MEYMYVNYNLGFIYINLTHFFPIAQQFGKSVGSITPNNFLQAAYKHQIRLLNFLPNFPFPKMDCDSQRGWKTYHTYPLLKPLLIKFQRDHAEQVGDADSDDPSDDEEDSGFYFEPWTEGMLILSNSTMTNSPLQKRKAKV